MPASTVCRVPRHLEKAPLTSKTVPPLVTQAVKRAKLLHNIVLLRPLTLPAPLHLDTKCTVRPISVFCHWSPVSSCRLPPTSQPSTTSSSTTCFPTLCRFPAVVQPSSTGSNILPGSNGRTPTNGRALFSARQPIPGCSSIVHLDTSSKLSFQLHASPCLPSHHSPDQASSTSDWLFPRLISQRLQTFRTAGFPTQ